MSQKYGALKVLSALFMIMIGGMLLTLTANLPAFVIGAILFTGCFFGCHSIGLSWVSKNATHARGQATALYLFFYYMGGSVVGYCNGLIFSAAGWLGMTAFIITLLIGGILVATYLNGIQRVNLVAAQSNK
ncbi:hypothetical protein DZS_50550 [Dickeya ananatis]